MSRSADITVIKAVGAALLASCLLAATPSPTPPQSVPTGRQMLNVFNDVYQIKTATEASAPKAAYGSCFVVDVSGLLATNYHVVAFALHEPEKYNLYLMDGDKPIAAEVVAFDVINDLALVRVAKTFPKAVTFAGQLPEAGAKIFSMGWPEDLNKSVIEGNYNGLMTAGPYKKLQMSIPLNPGMSGGPTMSESGEVIGVNVSLRTDSQSLAFAVPMDQVKALIKKKRGTYSRPEDHDAFVEDVRAQLDRVQDQLAKQWHEPASTVSVDGWLADKPAKLVKCWHEEDSGPLGLTSIASETCYLPGSSPVRADTDTATFHLKYQALSSTRLNSLQFVHQLDSMLPNFGFQLAERSENFTTKFSCNQSDFINSHKVALRLHYCVSAYVPYAGAYNVEFEAVTLPQERRALLLAGSFLGFSSRNAAEIMRLLVNSIRPESP